MKPEPDMNDPYRPDLTSTGTVECLHCGEEYLEKEVKWSPEKEIWVCKNYPSCDGAGVGFDIFKRKENDLKM